MSDSAHAAALRQGLVGQYDELKSTLTRRLGSEDLAGEVLQETYLRLERPARIGIIASRSLQSICKDMNFVIRFGRIGCGGGNHGCEGHFGKEVCCAAERWGTGGTR